MQSELDELLRAVEQTREQFMGIENLTDEQIEKIPKVLEDDCDGQKDDADGRTTAPHERVERLLKRYERSGTDRRIRMNQVLGTKLAPEFGRDFARSAAWSARIWFAFAVPTISAKLPASAWLAGRTGKSPRKGPSDRA